MAGRTLVSVTHWAAAVGVAVATLVAPTALPVAGRAEPVPVPPLAARAGLFVHARPTDGSHDPQGHGYSVPDHHVCVPHVCVHWVSKTDDAPPLGDTNGNGVPDQVDRTLATFAAAWAFEVGHLRFRAPRSDAPSANHGPDGRLDVYLADVGRIDLDGYTATDDPHASDSAYAYRNYSAYIVVDDDFSPAQLGAASGLGGLRVTAAHELFHAIQYAYDAGEDAWLMEGTAAWMEDRFADDVNANRVWLRQSPLTQPWIPVDSSRGLHAYGAWIFWRFLSESMGGGTADTAIIRRIWELAADAPGAPNLFSAEAVQEALAERDRRFGAALATFGMWNLAPAAFYQEGTSYPHAQFAEQRRLSLPHPTAAATLHLDHLTTGSVAFTPAPGSPNDAILRLVLDAPPTQTGSGGRVLVEGRSGAFRITAVGLDRHGDADVRVPFGRMTVRRVVLVYANASTSYDCWTGAGYSCNGRSHADRLPFRYLATIIG